MKASLAVLALAMSMAPVASQAGVVVSITVAPPVLPVYVQPAIPAEGYLWTPGYWAYGPEGYFWVPGVWVRPPQVGLLWTPGYWGWHGGVYAWNGGYWGPHVGFYGGVNYGFGFGGVGFAGGRWEGGHFAYNTAVNVGVGVNVGGGFHSYHETVVENNVHTSFNGGTGGLRAQPTASERSAMAEHHVEATREQTAHHEAASHDRSQLASVNHGRPANAAMSRPKAAAGAGANHAANGASKAGAPANKGGGAPNKSGGSMNKPAAAASKSGGAPNKGGGGASKPAAAAQHPSSGGGNKGGGGKPATAHGGGAKEGKK